MSDGFRVVTHGFRELEEALTKVVITVDPTLSRSLRALAEPVKQSVQSKATAWEGGGAGQALTAAGVKIRRRKLNVTVEQGQRKTTGQHGNYGGIQMRHFFLPALDEHKTEIETGVEAVIDRLTDI